MDALPPGKYKVRVESPGFQSLENQEEVGLGEETEAIYRLAPVSEGIEITVQGERPPREVTRRTIERREIDRIPGRRPVQYDVNRGALVNDVEGVRFHHVRSPLGREGT